MQSRLNERLRATLLTAGILIGLPLACSTQSRTEPPKATEPLMTRDGLVIPAGAHGVVSVPYVRVGMLMHLKGMQGHGKAVLRHRRPGTCLEIDLKFIAGSFDGNDIGVHDGGSVTMIIRSPRVARRLARGYEIVSDEIRVSERPAAAFADIVLEEGLARHEGFILNPKGSWLFNIFRPLGRSVACR
ncbi:hypothetical protein [Oricola sp.]|uniref:hypothetical protein n=1 Tax=Oricola sp. TaxID=1979950 RepID=UPI003BAA7591